MAEYNKTSSVSGAWAKASEIKSGTRAKIVSETMPQPSTFQDKNGNMKMQDVAKVRFEGMGEPLNVSLNKATINGLVDAFGTDSTKWQNQYLTAETEKMRVGGKAVVALYLIPEGYKRVDDENGYAMIVKANQEAPAASGDEPEVELGDGEVNPDDIPF